MSGPKTPFLRIYFGLQSSPDPRGILRILVVVGRGSNSMRLVLFTDNLGSGGAQRQLCLLAVEFQRRGHAVSVLTYNSERDDGESEFFVPWLESHDVHRQRLPGVRRWRRPVELARALAELAPDAVLAFQGAASFYAELAGVLGRRWGLVVSERSARPDDHRGGARVLRLSHSLADKVTTNSVTNRNSIVRSWGWLAPKVEVVYNGVDLDHFSPQDVPLGMVGSRRDPLRLVVLASHQRLKNLENVLAAVARLRDHIDVHLRWYGGASADKSVLPEGQQFVREHGLYKEVEFLPPTRDARRAYWDSDAVLLASWYEGCPNVICEAMACGKPVIASAVSDIPRIVLQGVAGILFDPCSVEAIEAAVMTFSRLSESQRREMGLAGRRRAEVLFSLPSIAQRYLDLLQQVALLRQRL